MSVLWNLLMWGCMVWIAPLLYFLQKNECKPKKNIIAGVTLPWEVQRDGEVLALLERFRRELKRVCWASLAVAVPCLFIKSFGISLTLWFIWLIAFCCVFHIPYIRCNKSLRKLKEARGWQRDGSAPQQMVTDLKAAAEEMRWLSPWWFLPPFLISLVPLLFDRTVWWLWTLDAALIPVSYLCYRHLYRNRAEVVDEDSERTIALTRIRRYNWGKCWLTVAWATGAFNAGLWLTLDHIWWCMAMVLVYGLAVCAAVAGIEFRVRRLQEKLTADSSYCVDEDGRWIWGMFYYNPNDVRLLVNARVGINSTFNMARRSGQIITGICLAILLSCPLIGLWITAMEHAPVELEIIDSDLAATHFGGHWSVALEDIAEIEVVEELPRMSRAAGVGMDNALTGQFNAAGWGRVALCIDPRTGPWLLVTAEDGKLYLFGSSEAGAAEQIALLLGAE